MSVFIMASLAICMITVLLALCIQFLRMEKGIVNASETAEVSLKDRYS